MIKFEKNSRMICRIDSRRLLQVLCVPFSFSSPKILRPFLAFIYLLFFLVFFGKLFFPRLSRLHVCASATTSPI
jgi:uncharacterized RDD family membrane protein YckC